MSSRRSSSGAGNGAAIEVVDMVESSDEGSAADAGKGAHDSRSGGRGMKRRSAGGAAAAATGGAQAGGAAPSSKRRRSEMEQSDDDETTDEDVASTVSPRSARAGVDGIAYDYEDIEIRSESDVEVHLAALGASGAAAAAARVVAGTNGAGSASGGMKGKSARGSMKAARANKAAATAATAASSSMAGAGAGAAAARNKGPTTSQSDARACDICFAKTSAALVHCPGCTAAVHEACLLKPLAAGAKWKCEPCKAGIKRIRCMCCPNTRNRVMVRSEDGYWVHIACMLWIDPRVFESDENLKLGIRTALAKRKGLHCQVCESTKPDAPVQCEYGRCLVAFHVTCATQAKGYDLRVEEESDEDGELVKDYRRFCPKHRQIEVDLDDPCQVCKKSDDVDLTLVCDNCNKCYHTFCLKPPLSAIPEGDWFCADCVRLKVARGDLVQIAATTKGSGRQAAQRSKTVALTDDLLDSMPVAHALASDDEEGSVLGSDSDEVVSVDSEPEDQVVEDGQAPNPSGDIADARKRNLRDSRTVGAATESKNYFEANSKTARKAAFGVPKAPLVTTLNKPAGAPPHTLSKARLLRTHHAHFPRWSVLLREGFNMLCFGYGSKKDILEQFVGLVAQENPVVVVNGYMPGFSLKALGQHICTDLLRTSLTFSSVLEQFEFIANCFGGMRGVAKAGSKPAPEVLDEGLTDRDLAIDPDFAGDRLFIVLHNLDGLKSAADQTAISTLASAFRIHIVASVDHVNAPVLLDQRQRQRGNWVWVDVTTFQPYIIEASHMEASSGNTEELSPDRLRFVLQSLTPNQRAVLKLLTEHQLSPTGSGGMEYREYLRMCMDALLVPNDQAFKSLLHELRDHDLVKSVSGGADHADMIRVPLSSETLSQLLQLLS